MPPSVGVSAVALSVVVTVGELTVELDLLSELSEDVAETDELELLCELTEDVAEADELELLCELTEDVAEADKLELLCELTEDVVEEDELELPSKPSEVVELLHPAKVNIVTALKIPANNFFMSKSPLQIY